MTRINFTVIKLYGWRWKKKIRERQKEGVKFDDNFDEAYQEWKNHEITAVEAMQRVGMKNNTFYRIVKEYEHNLEEKKLF